MNPTTSWKALTLVTALLCGLSAGVFTAFSTFVMSGLSRLPAAQGIAAMNSINVTAVRPGFMTVLFGPALRDRGGPTSTLLLVGIAVYLVGVVGLTVGYHVPLNDSLATVDPRGAGAVGEWNDYVSGWTRWNHVRALAGLASTAAFTMALLRA
jgi:uncharacterized membrane protein